MNTKIGITEAGDASFDYSWVNKLENCSGAILITKNVTDYFINEVLKHKDKLIIHASCTGMGGTIVEPNVPVYSHQLEQVQKLINMGFPSERIIIRIDPIIPTEKGLQTAQNVIDASPIKHFRISIMDAYPHVRARFLQKGINPPYGPDAFQPQTKQITAMRNWLAGQNPAYIFECCAEPKLADLPNVNSIGCVSENDLKLLKITTDEVFGSGFQRRECKCLSCKTELLNNKHRCPHGCLYCYWKD